MKTEVIISTYDNPAALDLCLHGLVAQSTGEFRICIADDGSGSETQTFVEKWRGLLGASRFRQVWHPDTGFQKNKILNQAIRTSTADYLIFIDGDCIARKDFVQVHLARRRPGFFLTGGVIRLPPKTSSRLSARLISSGEIFSLVWLSRNGGVTRLRSLLKLACMSRSICRLLDWISPVKKTWNGGHSSGWRRDLAAVNGFDETIQYGGEDVELGIRLNNLGIVGEHVRYSAPLLHLHHERGYVHADQIARNRQMIQAVRHAKKTWTVNGITQSAIDGHPPQ